MRKALHEFSEEPVYNMKAVEQHTAITAATLRAWERRYRLIEPKRTPSGYRLYSERDVALLRWVSTQLESGLTISRIVAMLQTMIQSNEPIMIDEAETHHPVLNAGPLPPSELVAPLYHALISLDADQAGEILGQAFAMYPIVTVCSDLITPTLIEIGEAWHRGEILVSTEHYATAYLHGRLLSLLVPFRQRSDLGTIMVGCAPLEHHEIGALMFAVVLRQHGYNVIYLGADVPVDDLIEMAAQHQPDIICLSAATPGAALSLQTMQSRLDKLDNKVLFAYGGRAFDIDPELRTKVSGYYLGLDPREALQTVDRLLKSRVRP